MSLWVALFLFSVGIVLVIKGGDWFVDAASWIAKAAGIPTFIIGATIVSIATTMPEMIVSVMAAVEGKCDMAVGNAVGSVIANTALIMALSMIFLPIVIQRKKYLPQCLLFVGSAVVLWLGGITGSLQMWASVVLALMFGTFMYLNIRSAKQEMLKSETAKEPFQGKILFKNIMLFIVGAAAIVLGSNFLIDGGSEIATNLGVPERVIAVTMVAIGTSLPELVTAITAIKKGDAHLSVGNIIGANIINLTLILPISALASGAGLTVSQQAISLDMPICLLVSLIATIPFVIKERAYKAQGFICIAVYAVFLFLTVR